MFLRKITVLKTIGRFRTAAISGGEYEPFTLFYAGNGRGKTTLCAVLRSLQENEPSYILKRRTFQVVAPQEVQLLLDSGVVRFSGGAWNASCPDIHIFDQHFVNANVHGGHQIGVDHRRNFYRVVVGPKGVQLAQEVDQLDVKASSVQQQITAEKRVLQQHVPQGMTLDAFMTLATDPDVDAKIAETEKNLKAVEHSAEIAAHVTLRPIALPSLPADFETLMSKGLPEVSAQAAASVQAQLDAHDFHKDGEEWLGVGLAHVRDEKCPFCRASVAGSDLFKAYQGYFSLAYQEHKNALLALSKASEEALGQAAGLKASQGFKEAEQTASFWIPFVDNQYAAPAEAANLVQALGEFHQAVVDRISVKIAAPLEDAPASERFTNASQTWATIRAALEDANAGMTDVNLSINAVKIANASTNKQTVTAELKRLKAVRDRHAEPFAALAKGYDDLVAAKDACVVEKDAKKAELDTYDTHILSAYEREINALLARFNAGFRLAKCGKNYVGKIPQSAYCLQFDGTDVDVSKVESDKPSFDSTMSAGDKSTFALAFFLTQLKRDADIGKKVVVFDDPFTSLDDFRREMTAKAIVRVGEDAKQVIVFSHDKYFLESVRQKIQGVQCAAMQISALSGNSALEPWDIEREVKEGYLQDHMTLADFVNGVSNDAKPMRTMMRPLLEKYIRYRFPNQIQASFWLGDMLRIIRDTPGHPLTAQYKELDDINEYTAPFHHDPNTAFNADEVLAHARRTIAIVGGC